MSQIFEPILPVPEITEPLALKDSGDYDRFNTAAESNITDMHDLAEQLNADTIPKLNRMGEYIYANIPIVTSAAQTTTAKAQEAAASATSAATSAASAANSATAAATSATNAATSAANAKASEDAVRQMYGGLTDGATPLPTPLTPAARDSNGCSQFGDPVQPQDAVNKRYLESALGGVGQSLFFPGIVFPYDGAFDATGKHPLIDGVAKTDWQICDGTNGTLDMRGRFLMGASDNYPVNSTGGSETHTHTTTINLGEITLTPAGTLSSTAVSISGNTGSASVIPTGTIGATTLTLSQIPAHSHDVPLTRGAVATAGATVEYLFVGSVVGAASWPTRWSGGGGSHTHTFTGLASNHAHSISIASGTHLHTFTGMEYTHGHTADAATAGASSLPPYRAINFIKYIGG